MTLTLQMDRQTYISSIQMDFENIEKSNVVSRKKSFRSVNRCWVIFFLFFLYKSNLHKQNDLGLFSDLQLKLYKSELFKKCPISAISLIFPYLMNKEGCIPKFTMTMCENLVYMQYKFSALVNFGIQLKINATIMLPKYSFIFYEYIHDVRFFKNNSHFLFK